MKATIFVILFVLSLSSTVGAEEKVCEEKQPHNAITIKYMFQSEYIKGTDGTSGIQVGIDKYMLGNYTRFGLRLGLFHTGYERENIHVSLRDIDITANFGVILPVEKFRFIVGVGVGTKLLKQDAYEINQSGSSNLFQAGLMMEVARRLFNRIWVEIEYQFKGLAVDTDEYTKNIIHVLALGFVFEQ
jgi:hypothetical protein